MGFPQVVSLLRNCAQFSFNSFGPPLNLSSLLLECFSLTATLHLPKLEGHITLSFLQVDQDVVLNQTRAAKF